MTDSLHDLGLLTVLLQRMETQRLPRALTLKEKVDRGERLADADLAFLKDVFADTRQIKPFSAKGDAEGAGSHGSPQGPLLSAKEANTALLRMSVIHHSLYHSH